MSNKSFKEKSHNYKYKPLATPKHDAKTSIKPTNQPKHRNTNQNRKDETMTNRCNAKRKCT